MPKQTAKHSPQRTGALRKKMARLDAKEGWSQKEVDERKRLGLPVSEHVRGSHGNKGNLWRDLAHYAPIHETLLRHIPKLKGKRGVHIGGASGLYTRYLQELGAMAINLDKSQSYQLIAKKIGNREMVGADARANPERHLPFRDSSLDFFISDHLLLSGYADFEDMLPGNISHSNSLATLREMHRMLKAGGIGIVNHTRGYINDHTEEMRAARKMGFEVAERGTYKETGETVHFMVLKKRKKQAFDKRRPLGDMRTPGANEQAKEQEL